MLPALVLTLVAVTLACVAHPTTAAADEPTLAAPDCAVGAYNDPATGQCVVPIVPRDQLVGGRSLSQWTTAWWQWRLSLPKTQPPPNASSCYTARQAGPVWFLGSSVSNKKSITFTCSIPAGRYIMVGGGSVCDARSSVRLLRCARKHWQEIRLRETATLDGVSLYFLGFLVATPIFKFTTPRSNNLLPARGYTSGRAAVYGLETLLSPLSAGTHTLILQEQFKGMAPTGLTFQLTVS